MNKRRLLKLADLLEADAKNKKGIQFDYAHWGSVDSDAPMSCGTTACAFGLAAISGAFKRAGLGWRVAGAIGWRGRAILFTLNGRKSKPIVAAAKVFDITKDDVAYLFTGADSGISTVGAAAERKVAKAIRDFVAVKGQP